MTPDPMCYYRGTYKGQTVFIEVSKGTGIYGDKIYGVTFRNAHGEQLGGENLSDDPSKVCYSWTEVKNYLADL